MSEADVPATVPVTKDPALVNGDGGDEQVVPADITTNGINKPVMDVSNGVDRDPEFNGDLVQDGGAIPVNGDVNGQGGMDVSNEDLMGDDELPPPPEAVSELPPPPPVDLEPDSLMGDSSVPQGDDSGTMPSDSVMVDSLNESGAPGDACESVPTSEPMEDSIENVKGVEDLSEEELVSDGGLKDEMDVEIQNNQANEVAEQGQLIDFGGAAAAPEPTVGSPVEMSGGILEPDPIERPPEPEPEPIGEPEPVSVKEPEDLPEPAPEQVPVPVDVPQVVEPEPELPVQEVISSPEEPMPELEAVSPVVEQAPEEPAQDQPQVGYAEPDIIVDNKPAEEEPVREEAPPPPPPPLVEETPPPPPPLDESVPLKRDSRRSGGSTPNKQSPAKEIEPPVPEIAVCPVAVPVPAPAEPEPEPEREPERAPEHVAVCPPKPVVPIPIPEPVITNSPQAEAEADDVSPPASPTTRSETAGSETGQSVASPQVSQKINKKNFKNKIKFGVDLVEAALKQLNFLNNTNKHPSLYEEWLFKKAIRRYEAFWLPMAAEHKKECLAAPLDIEWVWHCHMLAPLAYETDCKNLVGLVVEHKLMSEKDRTKSLEKSKKYWTAKYPSEPFEIELVYKEPVVEEPKAEPEAAPVQNTEAEKPAEEAAKKEETEGKYDSETTWAVFINCINPLPHIDAF